MEIDTYYHRNLREVPNKFFKMVVHQLYRSLKMNDSNLNEYKAINCTLNIFKVLQLSELSKNRII